MAVFKYQITLIDTKALKTALTFALVDTVYADALTGIAELKTAIEAVTDANVYSENLIQVVSGGVSLPADADITDEALVILYLTGAAEIPKYWNLRIPAPVVGVFSADGVTIDIADVDLIALVAALETRVLVSDGEAIDTTQDDGIKSGFWRSVKKTTA